MSSPSSLRIATRGSALALWQAEWVASAIRATAQRLGSDRTVELVVVSTEGDRHTEVPLAEIGGKGVFVKEIQSAVLDGRADLAVHSAKDLPAESPAGLVIAAIPERADPRDCLVGARFGELAVGAVIASGAPRRRAQLAALRSDLRFAELRGNIDTRLERAGEFDAIVMAAAALERLGRTPPVVDALDVEMMVPQVGQGALGVECRADDDATCAVLQALDHAPSRTAVEAERAFLRRLGGDCDLPAGAYATIGSDDSILIDAVLTPAVGAAVARVRLHGSDPFALGVAAADRLSSMVAGDHP